MNAVVAKRDVDPWPAAIQEEREELPGFWTFRVGQMRCSAHRLGTVVIATVTYRVWYVHAPLAILQGMQAAGLEVRTLKQIAALGGAIGTALRNAWKRWLVNGTWTPTGHAPVAVTDFPWRFSGTPGVGVDGAMNVSALVRPCAEALVLGTPEDHDGEDASI